MDNNGIDARSEQRLIWATTRSRLEADNYKIAIVHAPSLYDVVAANGYRLYLCGHTHGGQICLPGGRPVIVHLRHGRQFYRGLWRHEQMTGYTGQGAGTVGIPLRFNTESEITLFRLNRGPA
jgi:predicted MPP superfamily phosphohydrolase